MTFIAAVNYMFVDRAIFEARLFICYDDGLSSDESRILKLVVIDILMYMLGHFRNIMYYRKIDT